MNSNEAIFQVYKSLLPQLRLALKDIDSVKERISCPFLIHVFPEYENAKVKLFIVGQQTNSWIADYWTDKSDFDAAEYWTTTRWDNHITELISNLVDVYRGFHLGEKYVYNSELLKQSHQLYRKLNQDGPDFGFLWSDLVKIDQNKKRPQKHIEEMVCQAFPVLPLEIKITHPDIVVFFTGPLYDERLQSTFKGLKFSKLEGFEERTFARVICDGLPQHSYRTYHPNFFKHGKVKRLQTILDEILQLSKMGNKP